MTFQELNLTAPLLQAVKEAGYQKPSPIQQKAIPPVLAGRDLLGCAQTGTGKTAAFALPILQRLAAAGTSQGRRPIRALILTPTRELALQIQESFETYGKHLPLRSTVIFGGVGQAPQVAQLKRGVDVLVATPGRLNDLIGQGYIKLDKLNIFVLDEADRMLDMGFVHDVKKVIKHLPKERQTLLYSATMPPEIVKLADGLLTDPAKVFVTPPATTVEKIAQSLYKVDKANKRHLLAKLLRSREVNSALVFTRTKHGADRVVRELKREGIQAMAIHGNKSQTARQKALADFKEGKVLALVATDIAARGLDISELSHVFNYDLPNIPDTYVHRIGRTGRAGHGGIAISFCCAEELPYLKDIEKLIGFSIPEEENHPWPMRVTDEAPAPEKGKVLQKPAKKALTAQNIKAVGGNAANLSTQKAQKNTGRQAENQKSQKREKKPDKSAQNRRGRGAPMPDPYENLAGGKAIVTKKPVWATQAGADAPAGPAAGQPQKQGEDDMSRNNRRRRGKSRSAGPEGQPATGGAPAENKVAPPQNGGDRRRGGRNNAKKNEPPKNPNGVFDFSEEELAEDTSLRLISSGTANGEAKYASFEDFLKDH